jgi:hypothetical protein
MMSYEQCPEFAGPQSEGTLFGAQYGDPGYPTIGRPPRQMSIEQMERERAAAAAQFERRQRVEAAAISISASVLEGRKLADDILSEAAVAAARAVTA